MNSLVLDTDVLIDYLRGHPLAVSYLESLKLDRPFVSVVTVVELYAGVREGGERLALESMLDQMQVIDLNSPLAVPAGVWLRQYKKSHGTGLADCMIAAIASNTNATLVTLNAKHFPMLTDVLVPYTK